MSMQKLFHPRGIAIVGASPNPLRVGGQPFHALIAMGFKGGIYPVNPGHTEMCGRKCYATVEDIDGPCDLALLAVPSAGVGEVVRQCGRKGIAFAVILSSGFREMAGKGAALEKELLRIAEESGVRFVGPNCMGILNVTERMHPIFGMLSREHSLRAGSVSLVTQSGAFGSILLSETEKGGVGFRYLVSSGNEAQLRTPDFLEAFLDDEGTTVTGAFMEGLNGDGQAFLNAGRKALRLGKPVVVWKVADTPEGKAAALVHTATPTGNGEVFRAALRQVGMVAADDVADVSALLALFSSGKKPAGNRIAVLSLSGGAGIAFTDIAVRGGLVMPGFTGEVRKALEEIIPEYGSVNNPVDLTGTVWNNMDMFASLVNSLAADPDFDQICFFNAAIGGEAARIFNGAIAAAAGKTDKLISVVWAGRREKAEEGYAILEDAGVPVIVSPVVGARAHAAVTAYHRRREELLARDETPVAETAEGAIFREAPGSSRPDPAQSARILGIPWDPDAAGPCVLVEAYLDEIFGPVIAVSPETPYAALVGDVAYRVPPFGATTAEEMLDELRAAPLLRPHGDMQALAAVISRLAGLVGSLRHRTERVHLRLALTSRGIVLAGGEMAFGAKGPQ